MIAALVVPLALAGEPTRCVASWSAPEPGCMLVGTLQAESTKGSAKGAERAARRAFVRTAEHALAQLQGTLLGQPGVEERYTTCSVRIPESARVDCGPADPAGTGDYCFLTFTEPGCWDGSVVTFDRGDLQTELEQRAALCTAVDARLVAQNYTNLAERRLTCQEACVTTARVACPAQ